MLKQKTVHATKILSVPHFFHGQSSPPETLAQCAEATFFFREKLWFGIHRIFGAGEEQKNTMDASMMMKLMGLIDVCFFFRFCWMIALGSCTRLPSLEATSKSWKKNGGKEAMMSRFPSAF